MNDHEPEACGQQSIHLSNKQHCDAGPADCLAHIMLRLCIVAVYRCKGCPLLCTQVLVDDPTKLEQIRDREADITKERIQKVPFNCSAEQEHFSHLLKRDCRPQKQAGLIKLLICALRCWQLAPMSS